MECQDSVCLLRAIRDEAFQRMEQAYCRGDIEYAQQIRKNEWQPLVELCRPEEGVL